ncbi:MAG: hypothetical protein AABW64_03260 [Nanoarchaeota archaeon]
MDHKKIEEQAKAIMDNFFAAISEIKLDEELKAASREAVREAKASVPDPLFRTMLFTIAVKKDGDLFVAEKGKWI